MQQFGFSATDVKLKQWDETPKSAATQTFSPTEISSGTQMPSQLFKASSLSQKPCPNSRVKTHPFGENCLVKAIPQSRWYQPGMDAHAFGRKSGFVVRALEGYQQQGKGLVLVKTDSHLLKSSTSRASCSKPCVNTA